jgi:hypothetical protein
MNEAWKVGSFAILLVLCVALAGLLAYQHQKTGVLQDKVTDLTEQVGKANEELGKNATSCATTDAVVADNKATEDEYDVAQKTINANLEKGLVLSIKEAQVKQNDKSETVKSVNASTDAVLADSMWQSYCTVQPDDTDCTARRAALKVPVH